MTPNIFDFFEVLLEGLLGCIACLNRIVIASVGSGSTASNVGFFTIMISAVIYDLILSNIIRRG